MSKTAIILAGGSAISNGSLAAVGPKLLLPIANRALVEYLASVLRTAGISHLIISLDLGSSEASARLAENLRDSSLRVECVVQETPRGTGGSLKEVEALIQDDVFWVVSGDLFLETDLRQMLAFHREIGSAATVASVRIQEPVWEMERIEADADGRVRAIHRIHPAQSRRSSLRPAGLYLFEPTVLDLIPKGRHFDLKEQLFPRLAERGMPASVWEVPGYCRMISSVSDYFDANRDILLGRVRFEGMQLWPLPDTPGWARPRIAPTAMLLDPVVVGPGCRIDEGVMVIGPTTIGENCEVGASAILDECVVLADARVGQGARLDRCILGEGAEVEDGAVLREMIVLEKPVGTGDLAMFPGKHVPLGSTGLMRSADWRTGARRVYLLGKRLFEAVFAAVGLGVSAPLMGLIAMAIKLDTPGEIIFRQRRCGLRGREFTMYKFRSMVANAEDLKRELLPSNEVDGPMFKIIADPRVTRVGRVLRATNLDELPQLWNVLRGEMSLVGPRPLFIEEMRFSPRWRDIRLSVRPGLTGLWQVLAHTKVSFADWIRCDIYYVRNMSPWLDLKILFKTVLKMLGFRMG
ncbi:MAG: sugar transferase [Acidobacteria bacterium]|nr:sugar transferase [Acidobacteriota bacterium]